MNRRIITTALGIVGPFAFLALGWRLPSPPLFKAAVDEAFPFEEPGDAKCTVTLCHTNQGGV